MTNLKIYVGASYASKIQALLLSNELKSKGCEITSRWPGQAALENPSNEEKAIRCQEDIEDMERSNALVLLTDVSSTTGGFHTELGYFLGKNRAVATIGQKRPSVFFFHSKILHYPMANDANLKDMVLNLSKIVCEVKETSKTNPEGRSFDGICREYVNDSVRAYHPNMFADVMEFYQKFRIPFYENHEVPTNELKQRLDFMAEELIEYSEAVGFNVNYSSRHVVEHQSIDHEKAFDGLLDLCYVAIGTACKHGFTRFNEGWRRVHEANMRKERGLRNDPRSHRQGTDVVKPEGWKPPQFADLLNFNGEKTK